MTLLHKVKLGLVNSIVIMLSACGSASSSDSTDTASTTCTNCGNTYTGPGSVLANQILANIGYLNGAAGQVCETGAPTKRFANPLEACLAAYNTSLLNGKFDQALRYAALGCEKYHYTYFCSRVAALPHLMGYTDQPVPEVFISELRRVAHLVCVSEARFNNLAGADITGRLCAHFARQFVLAKDDNWRFLPATALQPFADRFVDAIYDPRRAGELHKVACERWGYINSCRDARELGQQAEALETVRKSAATETQRKESPPALPRQLSATVTSSLSGGSEGQYRTGHHGH